jgi:hypothetical protein
MMNKFVLQIGVFATFLLFLMSQAACYADKEGCLDIAAVNFDAAADKDCCCQYPKLVFNVKQIYGDSGEYAAGKVYPGLNGHLFRIQQVHFYLSDARMLRQGQAFFTTDSLNFSSFGATQSDTITQRLRNDFVLLSRAAFTYTVGSFREIGDFDQVQVRLGLPAEAQKVIATRAPAGNVLGVQADSLWYGFDKGYVWAQMIVVRDSAAATRPDTLSFTAAELGERYLIGNGVFSHEAGKNFVINLQADYQQLFENVDWVAGNPASWKPIIVANLQNVFSFSP